MHKEALIYIAGHRGLVGSAIVKALKENGYNNLVFRTHDDLDLSDQNATAEFFADVKPEYVFLAAAKVGGIIANSTYRGTFIYNNLMIQNNVIHQSYLHDVKKLLFLGSTCIYPKNSMQPIKEDYLLTDTLEFTNEPYAIAKIAGIKMCESYNIEHNTNFISVMPTNLYGPNDNFDLQTSHVLPALLRKIHLGYALENANWELLRKDLNNLPINGVDGKATNLEILEVLKSYGVEQDTGNNKVTVTIWGTGKPLREFLWSEDMAEACVYVMQNVDFEDIKPDKGPIRNTHINIGTGKEVSIKDLALKLKEITGYKGHFKFDRDKPDGTMRKLTDVHKINNLGWQHNRELDEGLKTLYDWYLNRT